MTPDRTALIAWVKDRARVSRQYTAFTEATYFDAIAAHLEADGQVRTAARALVEKLDALGTISTSQGIRPVAEGLGYSGELTALKARLEGK